MHPVLQPERKRAPAARAEPQPGHIVVEEVIRKDELDVRRRLVPLVLLTRRRSIMGALVNRPLTTAAASIVAGLIIALNGFLLFQTFA